MEMRRNTCCLHLFKLLAVFSEWPHDMMHITINGWTTGDTDFSAEQELTNHHQSLLPMINHHYKRVSWIILSSLNLIGYVSPSSASLWHPSHSLLAPFTFSSPSAFDWLPCNSEGGLGQWQLEPGPEDIDPAWTHVEWTHVGHPSIIKHHYQEAMQAWSNHPKPSWTSYNSS